MKRNMKQTRNPKFFSAIDTWITGQRIKMLQGGKFDIEKLELIGRRFLEYGGQILEITSDLKRREANKAVPHIAMPVLARAK